MLDSMYNTYLIQTHADAQEFKAGELAEDVDASAELATADIPGLINFARILATKPPSTCWRVVTLDSRCAHALGQWSIF